MSLTKDEHEAMELTAQLVDLFFKRIIVSGSAYAQDSAEFVSHIHNIQRMILAQSAAREYPDKYRLLGAMV